MKYLLIENEEGRYLNEEQDKRYDILECHEAIGPRADEFIEFENLQKSIEFYHLIDTRPDEPQEEINIDNSDEITAYRKEENPAGIYQDKIGERYNIFSESFEEVPEGWTAFESEEEAAAAWDLTPIEEE